jgi:O-antigen/teichoic acid export membrane protein
MQPLTVRQNFTWVAAGNVFYSACQWGIIVALAKFGSLQQVGQYTLGLAVAAPVFLLANLQLNAVVATDTRHEHSFGNYLMLRLLTSAIALVLVIGIALAGNYSAGTRATIVVLGVMKGFDAISDIFSGLLQQRERMDRVAIAFAVNGGISMVLVTLTALTTHDVVLAAVASTIGSGFALVTVNGPAGVAAWKALEGIPDHVLKRAYQAIDRAKILRLVRLAAPLGAVMFLISLGANVPRYVIAADLGEGNVGLYSALVYTLVAATTVNSAMGQAASPRLAARFADGDTAGFLSLLRSLLVVAVALAAVTVVVVFVAGQGLLTLLYRPEYATNPGLFRLLAVASGISFIASVLGYAMTAARYFKPQVPLFIVSVVATSIGCLVLVPRIGTAGAAWAGILAACIQVVGCSAIVAVALRGRRSRVNRGPA